MGTTNFKKAKDLGEKAIGAMVIVALLIANYGVLARYVLEIPAAWTDEITRAIFIWLIFISSAVAFSTDTLISLELVEAKLQGKPFARKCLKFVQAVLAIIFSVFCTYNGFLIVLKQFKSGETTPVVDIPLYFINLGFLIGASMLLFISVTRLRVAAVNLTDAGDK